MPTRPQNDVRVLLIEPDERLRSARANKLLTAGYQVSALPDTEGAPMTMPPRLYDVIVVSVNGDSTTSLNWCKQISRRNRAAPVVVLLADSPFTLDATFLPALVIAERTEKSAQEKLAAFLGTGIHRSGMGVNHV